MKTNRISPMVAFSLLLGLFGFFTTYSQSAAIKTKNGLLFVQNGVDKPFYLQIVGKSVVPQKSSRPTFNVDGQILQIVHATFDQVGIDPAWDDDVSLQKHMVWESEYLGAEIFGKKLKVESEKVTVGTRKALFWGFTRPALNDEFEADYFLTTIVGRHVVAVQTPHRRGAPKASAKEFLTSFFATLKVADSEIDIMKLAERIKQGKDL